MSNIASRMEYGRFFFIIELNARETTYTKDGKASLADILFQKLFSTKKSAKIDHFQPKVQKQRKSPNSAENSKISTFQPKS